RRDGDDLAADGVERAGAEVRHGDVLYNGRSGAEGAYFRLVDVIGSEPKRQALAEAIQNPDCGWFYRADASTFHDIP
ncbi:hypothetical protein RF263_07305, partial [Acinetobacter baumannii]|nr:hypothetical protein [Acinetobacter baumannii]